MPNSSTKATQGSVQSENRTNKINGQATAEDKQIMMMRFVSDLYVPVSARLQDPLYVPGSHMQDSASLGRFMNRPRPHSSTGFEGIGAQFIVIPLDSGLGTSR
ncbi:hypothetical protein FOCG_10248 [Fusarium oxysporum f. sp. radicis-lycopersici 26381]|uniref:Uncharacterized protein n=1 Tax=Fusarium oxysporum f. sp. melonis 26406 TaxID=1089452 RepID=X0AXT3_FUSOX|nr:hypothetical protein FOWG_06876 [Fusarium oxysporum f. sp. lycopersici MN25]EXK48595.1 hypothetical protein FOMG_01461 [Fusarium oxysporum f. sp. melonis 26406]EXL50202.1 hypothetical protein FOCG_10248 [Fusarium oxysporum f. sp. radicis-lycopersici 26381]EWZ91205.1 hypothetical protein FOWG_06876 [Fusarium oxysporum f. sp. lycopersici MN25]EXK48596.1 hypothetical protein FOMG_01461 [Fusarium oxysporum f. sp. melonis 26406]